MKKIAVVKIIVFSCLALVLCFVLGFAIKGTTVNSLASSYGSYRYADSDLYEQLNLNEEKVFDTKEISSIKVYWVGGNINIHNSATENISFSENSHETDVEDKYLVHYAVIKKVLLIRFSSSTWNIDKDIREAKDLDIYLPNKKFSTIHIETVSANIFYDGEDRENLYSLSLKSVDGNIDLYNTNIKSLKVDESKGNVYMSKVIASSISINEISGSVKGKDIVVDKMTMNFASSSIDLKGNIKKYITDGLSGSSKVKFENVPEEITGKFNSTTVVIEIPNNEGFTATLTSTTGIIKTEFEGTFTKENKLFKTIHTFKYLNETNKYNFESVSSNILIEMK